MAIVEGLLREYGYAALLVILFLDGSGIPWPTEATLVLTGVAAKAGHLNLLTAFGMSLAGGVLGSTFSYVVGRRLGPSFLRSLLKAFMLSPQYIDKVDTWFDKYGDRAVFFGRFIPFVRVLLGYPAGITGMNFTKYILFSAAGYAGYIIFALTLGYAGLSIAQLIGDLEIVLTVLGIFAVVVLWVKYGQKGRKS